MLPNATGIYSLFDLDKNPIYVGASTSEKGIRGRIQKHFQCNSHLYNLINPVRIAFVGIVLANKNEALILEKMFINFYSDAGFKLLNATRNYKNERFPPHHIIEKMDIVQLRPAEQINNCKICEKEIILDEMENLSRYINSSTIDTGFYEKILNEKTILLNNYI